jgi:uncharacterized membrane protein
VINLVVRLEGAGREVAAHLHAHAPVPIDHHADPAVGFHGRSVRRRRRRPLALGAMTGMRARMVLTTVFLLGLLAGAVAAFLAPWQIALLVGWDVCALSFLGWWWMGVFHLDPTGTKEHALLDDPGRGWVDLVLTLTSLASLIAVALVVSLGGDDGGAAAIGQAAFALGSVFASWALVHALYMLQYARLYYGDVPGGVDFNSDEPPQYSDFAYLAFSVGMTFQVSDTSLQTKAFRALVLRQSVLAYFYGVVVIAATINLVAGLRA